MRLKTWAAMILCLTGTISVYSLDLVLIPISYYEKQGTNYVQKTYRRDITGDIAEKLDTYYEVTIDKMPLGDRLAGATDFDARRAAESYHINDVLYGTIKGDENSLIAELKLYNMRRETYELIYASDHVSQYERLIKTISERIMDWYGTSQDKVDALRFEVRQLRSELAFLKEETEQDEAEKKERRAKEEIEKTFKLGVPLSLGYWSYTKQPWVELVQGTVEVRAGIDIYPELQFSSFGKASEVSLGLHLGYRNGVRGNRERLVVNGITVNPLLGYHVNFYTRNWLCLGAGIFYELMYWKITGTGFEERTGQSLTGFSAAVEYSYQLNRQTAINFGMNLNGYFVEDTSPVIRFYLGTMIRIGRGAP